MSKPFNIHDWQAKQRKQRLNEADEFQKRQDALTPGKNPDAFYGDDQLNRLRGNPRPDINSKTLLDLIARDLKFAGFYQNPEMLAFEEAVEIMDKVVAIEGADYTGLNALLDYIQEGEFDKGDKDVYIEPNEENIDEMNTTGGGASFNAGSGEGYMTPNAFKKKNKKD
jgi:PDZ domain-containing secreted protein